MKLRALQKHLRRALAKSDIYAKHREKLLTRLIGDNAYPTPPGWKPIEALENVAEWLTDQIRYSAKHQNIDWGIIKPYVKWIILTYAKEGIRYFEDISQAINSLAKFDKIKKKIPGNQRDINRYKSLNDLMDMLDEYTEETLKVSRDEQAKLDKKFIQNGDIERIYKSSKTDIFILKTEKGSCYVGKGSRWCTAIERVDNMFDSYNKQGVLFVIRNNDNVKESTQLWLAKYPNVAVSREAQYMDFNDRELDVENRMPDTFKRIFADYMIAEHNIYDALIDLYESARHAVKAGYDESDINKLAVEQVNTTNNLAPWFTGINVDLGGLVIKHEMRIYPNHVKGGIFFKHLSIANAGRQPTTLEDSSFKGDMSIGLDYRSHGLHLENCDAPRLDISGNQVAELLVSDCDIGNLNLGGLNSPHLVRIIGSEVRLPTIGEGTLFSNSVQIDNSDIQTNVGSWLNDLSPIYLLSRAKNISIKNTTFKLINHKNAKIAEIEEILNRYNKRPPKWKLRGNVLKVERLELKNTYAEEFQNIYPFG